VDESFWNVGYYYLSILIASIAQDNYSELFKIDTNSSKWNVTSFATGLNNKLKSPPGIWLSPHA